VGAPISAKDCHDRFITARFLLAYLRTPGWYRYIFLANTVALVFLAPAILTLYEKGSESLRLLRRFPWAPSVLIALLFIMQTYQLFTTSYLAAYFNSTRTHDLETYIATLPEDSSVFFDTVPEAAFFAPSSRVSHAILDYIVMTTVGKSDADLKYKPESEPIYDIAEEMNSKNGFHHRRFNRYTSASHHTFSFYHIVVSQQYSSSWGCEASARDSKCGNC
jgi:hypothetical protein